jgi:carbamoyltransferase
LITLGIHHGSHDGSIALLHNDKVIFHLQGERLSNIKYDFSALPVLNYVSKYTNKIDNLVITGNNRAFQMANDIPTFYPENYLIYLKSLNKNFREQKINVYEMYNNHHEIHASTSFYNSGFDEALCVVIDGFGSACNVNYSIDTMFFNNLVVRETKSSFIMSYPNKIDLVETQLSCPSTRDLPDGKNWLDQKRYITKSFSEAMAYEGVSVEVGLGQRDSGKVMGMSSYGTPGGYTEEICKDGLVNSDLFVGKWDNMIEVEYVGPKIGESFEEKSNFAYKLQKDSEENVLNYILGLIEKTGQKNVCVSGGFFMNCVSNYNLLKRLPSDVKLYVEPLCTDIGNSIGAAKYVYYALTGSNKITPQNTLYYGPKYHYTKEHLSNEKIIQDVTPDYVAKLISEKNIVALYQGRSESGPRALGNRSILYDPRDPNGKDHVNTVKKREWFRPFAGSVLKENAKDWFDLQGIEESKSMMYAVDVLENKKEIIPAITHVDGTCRVQTVSKTDNVNFYELIEAFFKITGVPILFNTSFNLAGDVIVETLEDALRTIHKSDINYLYLPELKILVTK